MDAIAKIRRSCLLKLALFSINESRNCTYQFLKPLQCKVLLTALDNDVLAVLPTGYGKSIIFEALPRVVGCRDNTSSSILLVSPLNSIIIEQMNRYGESAIEITDELNKLLGIHFSVCLSSSTNCSCPESITKITSGNFLYAIGHPEHMISKVFFKLLRNLTNISHIVIDEAHCVEKWGKEFRQDFARLNELRSVLPKAKVLALTGTASTDTQKVIKHSLSMKDAVTYQKCILRDNIKLLAKRRPNYSAGSEESFLVTIKPFVEELKEKKENFPKTVIYCNLKWCGTGYEECQRRLSENELKLLVSQYHAPCTNEMKDFVVNSMTMDGSTRLLFATEAYSMGTDTPNIRRIVHFGVPKSMESYMQEVGRAGRDGNYAEAIMYFNNNDIAKNVLGLDKKMAEYCRHENCRWNFLCLHFGCLQEDDRNVHACCDNCALKCSCQKCNSERDIESHVGDGISVRKDGLNQMLMEYFAAENSLIPTPNQSLYTGLSTKLAFDICHTNLDVVKAKFSFIEKKYLSNIISIVEYFETCTKKPVTVEWELKDSQLSQDITQEFAFKTPKHLCLIQTI